MSRQEIHNNDGTDLMVAEGKYISVGKDGADIVIRNGDKMIWFDGDDAWERLVNAIDTSKANLSSG